MFQSCNGALLTHLISRLDSFLELKIENEQLQRRFFELQNCLPLHPSSSPLVPPPNQLYTTSSIASIPPQRSTALSNLYGPTCWTVFDNPSNSIDTTLFTDETIHPSPPSGDDGAEDGSKKKKVSMFHAALHVCSSDDHQSLRSHTLQSNTSARNVVEQTLPNGARCAMIKYHRVELYVLEIRVRVVPKLSVMLADSVGLNKCGRLMMLRATLSGKTTDCGKKLCCIYLHLLLYSLGLWDSG